MRKYDYYGKEVKYLELEKYTVMSIPTLILFNNGKETTRLIGHKPKEVIVQYPVIFSYQGFLRLFLLL